MLGESPCIVFEHDYKLNNNDVYYLVFIYLNFKILNATLCI